MSLSSVPIASRKPPCECRAISSRAASSMSMCGPPRSASGRAFSRSTMLPSSRVISRTSGRRKSKRWQRERMVARDLVRLGGGEDEDDVGRRLLERLEQGVEGLGGEHVDLVDDVDLEAALRPARSATFSRRSRMSSMPRLEAASISITSSELPSAMATQLAAGAAGRGVGRDRAAGRADAVERLGQDAGGGGLAGAARAGEEVGVGDAVGLDGVAQRAGDVLLPDDVVEASAAGTCGRGSASCGGCLCVPR